jgi:hypothetical protein
LFGLVALAAMGGLILLGGADEKQRNPKSCENDQQRQDDLNIRHQENKVLTKLVLVMASMELP